MIQLISFILFTIIFQGQEKPISIVFYGDSITAGYGIDPNYSYPAEIQRIFDKKGLNAKVTNAGLSGETSAGGLTRINWILKKQVDVFVLELGGNDGLRGLPLEQTRQNLQKILDTVKAKYPEAKIIVAGMEVPPNLGKKYTEEFRYIYPDLARKNDVTLIPFILDGVGGDSSLNQGDGIHPNADGHKIIAENVAKVIEELIDK